MVVSGARISFLDDLEESDFAFEIVIRGEPTKVYVSTVDELIR